MPPQKITKLYSTSLSVTPFHEMKDSNVWVWVTDPIVEKRTKTNSHIMTFNLHEMPLFAQYRIYLTALGLF